ncbi:uncharacterized protein LOC132757879 isoform X2 [Ruditapes philippinarum]|uniref:uncharacterized protein LOC132757879 isoform X2 n=1 Tax=Ruditapes philippinarum TaxID=129788 RepID=UPI00295BD01B|nr:uncharacterized protein LOC132757879 isoform X2 [Ruditapes philippinarum]
MKITTYSFSTFLFYTFISDYFVFIGAYSNFDIFNAPPANEVEDWELFDPDEYVKPSVEMDVPLRYEIKPTPVMLGMARSEFYNQRDYMGANRFEIIPDKALPGVEMTSFHHFIQKRQDPVIEESSGNIECSTLTQPNNGQMTTDCENQIEGCVLTFSCNEGYTLDGPSVLTCQDDGMWSPSNNPPECKQNVCPELNSPDDGTVSYPCRFAGCTVQYTCNEGYVINGDSAVLTCQSDGTWNGNPPTCVLRDCGDPGVASSTFTGSTTYGSTITFTCNTNYDLQGSATATCEADGAWGSTPTCIYNCGDPTVVNAQISYTCTVTGCTADVTCDAGYELEANSQMTCTDRQGWLYPPYCNPISAPSEGANVSVTFEVFSEEEQAFVRQNIELTLEEYYTASMPGTYFADVTILNIVFFTSAGEVARKKRQALSEPTFVQVNYTVFIENTTEAKGEFSTAQTNLTRLSTLPILGRNVDVLRTKLFGFTYVRNDTTHLDGLQAASCQIFEYTINGCPEGTVCRVHLEDDTTRCDPIASGLSDTDDDFALKVGLGVGITMFVLLCAILGCCCYWLVLARRRKRRRKRKRRYVREYDSSSSATRSGFAPGMIPIRFDTVGRRGPVYGSQFPELWEGTESVVDSSYDHSPQPHRRGSFPYVVSIGHEEERRPYTSNFSWDFMYPHVDDDFSLPRPKL